MFSIPCCFKKFHTLNFISLFFSKKNYIRSNRSFSCQDPSIINEYILQYKKGQTKQNKTISKKIELKTNLCPELTYSSANFLIWEGLLKSATKSLTLGLLVEEEILSTASCPFSFYVFFKKMKKKRYFLKLTNLYFCKPLRQLPFVLLILQQQHNQFFFLKKYKIFFNYFLKKLPLI